MKDESKFLYASYWVGSIWDLNELGIDLTTAYDWGIKWDILYVQRKENAKWEEFEGTAQYDDCYTKRPIAVYYEKGPGVGIREKNKVKNGEPIKSAQELPFADDDCPKKMSIKRLE